FLFSSFKLYKVKFLSFFNNLFRYIKLLRHYGLSFAPFQFRLYFTQSEHYSSPYFLQEFVEKVLSSPRKTKLIALWFTIGAFISLICYVTTPIYLLHLLISEFSTTFVTEKENLSPKIDSTRPSTALKLLQSPIFLPLHEHINAGITPVLPGLNLPLSHMPIFVAVLIIASILHEAGHAIAAVNANVRVTGLGFFVFAIYPGAFTEVEPNELDRCSYAQKLRIYGAGVWHNIILAIVGLFFLLLIPIIFKPFYSNNAGVIVTGISPRSGLYGQTGLQLGHQILRVNQCKIRNAEDWNVCLSGRIDTNDSIGFLAQFRSVSRMTASVDKVIHSDGEVQCCSEFNVTNTTHICFRYFSPRKRTTKEPVVQKPIFPDFPNFEAEFGVKKRQKRATNLKTRLLSLNESTTVQSDIDSDFATFSSLDYSHACLPAMQITEHAQCQISSRSSKSFSILPYGYVCVVPALYNDTVLLRFQVKDQRKPILFIGYLSEPLYFVGISELTPRFTFVPWWIPRIFELFSSYLITFSLAMGVLNAVPCYGLDGQFISSTVVNYFCQNLSNNQNAVLECNDQFRPVISDEEKRVFESVRLEHVRLLEKLEHASEKLDTINKLIPTKEAELKEIQILIKELDLLRHEYSDKRNVQLKLPHSPIDENYKQVEKKILTNFNLFEESIDFRSSMDLSTLLSVPDFDPNRWLYLPPLLPLFKKYFVSFLSTYKLTQLQINDFNELKKSLDISQDKYFIDFNCSNSCYTKEQMVKIYKQSTFTIILPDKDTFQESFYESLQAGSIPVICSLHTFLPFDEFVDWKLATIRIPPSRFPELHFILRSIGVQDLLEIKRKGRFYFENLLMDKRVLIRSIISLMRFRLQLPDIDESANSSIPLYKSNNNSIWGYPSFISTAIRPPYDDEYLGPSEMPIISPQFAHNFTTFNLFNYKFWNDYPFANSNSLKFIPNDHPLPSDAEFNEDTSFGMRPILPGTGVEFSKAIGGNRQREHFTILITTFNREQVLMNTLERLIGLPYLNKVIVVWNDVKRSPSLPAWPRQ
ncbi:Peptidase_M50 domain-containing protein, partial [Meloidogyne graminicola]